MKTKILILFFILLLCVSVNAIENPSFEIEDLTRSGNASNWDQFVPSLYYQGVYDNNGSCYSLSAGTTLNLPSYFGRNNQGLNESASDGNYFYVLQNPIETSKRFFLKNDFYIGVLSADLNIYWKNKTSYVDSWANGIGIYKPDLNIYCRILWVGNIAPTTWTQTYRTIPKGTYNGYLAFAFMRNANGSGDQNTFLDAFSSATNLSINILNATNDYALSEDSVNFKVKVLRNDLNSFITDANVQFYSNDFNGTMTYNSLSGFYELSNVFSSKFGVYDFNVIAYSTNTDFNYISNSKAFSLIFRKTSNQLSNVDNSVISEEYQLTTSKFLGIINPSDNSKNLIFKFTGQDGNINGSSIDFNFLIRNSELSGKRYLIYTASENDYLNGIWSFDSTLTFGSTISNGLQKIWIDANEFYEYSFKDSSVLSNEIKYYKLIYNYPFQYWDSLNPSYQSNSYKLNNWDLSLLPSVFISEAGHKTDYFPVSSYSNMRNQLKEALPDINSNTTYQKFLLVFNAVSNSAFTIQAGSNYGGSNDSITNVSVSTTNTTFNVNSGAIYPLIKADSTSFKQLTLSDYALIERGFFLKPIDLRNQDGTEIEAKLVNGTSAKVINEGAKFRIKTSLYNKNNKLSFIEAKVYFGNVNPSNQVAYFKKDLNFLTENELYHLNWLVDGIIDLNGTTARDFIVVVKATNTDGDWFEIQTDTFKLRQFPSGAGDFSISAFLKNKLVGEHLSGTVNIKTDFPETLRGIKMYLYKPATQSYENPDLNKVFWKDTDFSCSGFICSFNFEFKDHVLDSAETWNFIATALLTTMHEDVNNSFTTFRQNFPVNFIDVNFMRIVQTIERTDANYRNTEVIPLTLMLRTTDLRDTGKELNIKLRVSECSGPDNDCIDNIDVNYSPQSHVFDAGTGTNLYFWRNVFVRPDGQLLNDTMPHRVYAIVQSVDGKINGTLFPVLTKKCQSNGNILANSLTSLLLPSLGSCAVWTDDVVDLNSADLQVYAKHEDRFWIDNDFPLTYPNQECFFILNADQNNNYVNNLEQDIFAGVWYTFNSASIDRFDFYLGNKYSDYSKKGNESQYIKTSLPFELVAFNDLTLTKKSLAKEYGTEADTIGELALQGINNLFTGFANPLSDIFENWINNPDVNLSETSFNQLLITPVGYDCNFSKPLDPTFIGGMIFYKIKGIKTINQQDLIKQHSDLNVIETKDLLKYMNLKGYKINRKETTIEVYGSDMVKLATYSSLNPLIINESVATIKFNKTDENQNFESLPTKLRFQAISDLVYNNELSVKRLSVPFTLTAIITKEFNWLSSSIDSIVLFAENPVEWFGQNVFFILIILALLIIVSVIWYNFKVRGGN